VIWSFVIPWCFGIRHSSLIKRDFSTSVARRD
jgi:hypothetical protein